LVIAARSCTRDEGRLLEARLDEQSSNRPKLHGLRDLVASVEGKGMAEDRAKCGSGRRASAVSEMALLF
jgi:hypothetical protein